MIHTHRRKVRATEFVKVMNLDLTDVDEDSRAGSFKGGHEMLLNMQPYKSNMSETNDTKNGAANSKQIMS